MQSTHLVSAPEPESNPRSGLLRPSPQAVPSATLTLEVQSRMATRYSLLLHITYSKYLWVIRFHLQNNCVVDTIVINLLQRKNLSHKEVKSPAKGHPLVSGRGNNSWSRRARISNPGHPAPVSTLQCAVLSVLTGQRTGSLRTKP